MNGIEKITQRLLEDAKAEVLAMEADAKEQCAQIAQQFTKEADDVYWRHATAGKKAADLREQRLAGTAQLESKKQLLAYKQARVEEAFHRASEYLQNLPEEKYVALLATLVCKGVKTGTEKLIFSAKDRGQIGKAVTLAANEALSQKGISGNLSMSEETREIGGGVIITDGNVDLNCSISSLVLAKQDTLAGDIASILFD